MKAKLILPILLLAVNLISAQTNWEEPKHRKQGKSILAKEWQDGTSRTYGAFGMSVIFKNPSLLNDYFAEYVNKRPWLNIAPSVQSFIPEFNIGFGETFSNKTKIELNAYYRWFNTESEGISPLTDESSSRKFRLVNRGIQLIILKHHKSLSDVLNFGLGLDFKQTRINSSFNHSVSNGNDLILSSWTVDLLPELRYTPSFLKEYFDFYLRANMPLILTDLGKFNEKFELEFDKEKYYDWGLSVGMKITLY